MTNFTISPTSNTWIDTILSSRAEDKIYVVQTSYKVIQRCLLMTTDPGDLVLDPTCGSGTTAYVAEQWGRRWITIDTSRVAIALARTRLMAGRYPYYLLADSPEGMRKEAEITMADCCPLPLGRRWTASRAMSKKALSTNASPTSPSNPSPTTKRLTPSTPDGRNSSNPAQQRSTRLVGKNWQEWEIPRELTPLPSTLRARELAVKALLAEWWQLRRAATEGD